MRLGVIVAAVYGALAVAMGAFAAHALKGRLSVESLAVLQTAVSYQFIHALALLLVVTYGGARRPCVVLRYSAVFFGLGVFLFSGSLYALVLSPLQPGIITPIGGSLLILGWLTLGYSAWRRKSHTL